jgi:hypothetical protein
MKITVFGVTGGIGGHVVRQAPVKTGIPCSQISTNWRASQNKTANTYVIEIPI